MNTKHVDVVVKYFYPVAAGIETNIMETYSVLARNGWDVTLHTSRDSLTESNIYPAEETIRGIKVKRYPLWRFFIMPPISTKEGNIVALHNFNLIPHLTILLRALIAKMFGVKKYLLFVTPHGGFNPEWSIYPRLFSGVKSRIHYTIGTFLINHASDGARAVSEWEKEEMIKKGVRKELVAVIDNGLEDEAYMDIDKEASEEIKKKVADLGTYMIQIGRVYSIKNYETGIRSLPLIPKHIKFVIVGPIVGEQYKQKLISLAKSLGVEDRVVFFGVIRGVDKYYLIKHARMMVHMALWESFCNVVHEGLSQGLVCIVADNTALPLLIKNGVTGYCVPTLNHETLAEKINYVDSRFDSADMVEMRRAAMERGRKNSWREVAGRMDLFYKKAL